MLAEAIQLRVLLLRPPPTSDNVLLTGWKSPAINRKLV